MTTGTVPELRTEPAATPTDEVLAPPGWFALFVHAAVCLVVGLGAAGLLLAMAGWFWPWTVFPIGLALAAGLVALWRPASRPVGRSAQLAACGALLIAVAATALTGRYSAQHVVHDADPGVYVVTARWMARDGGLLVDTDREVFGNAPGLRYSGAGFYTGRSDGRLYAQFLHVLPAILGQAQWVGGTWLLLHLPPLLAGLGLLVFHGWAARLLRPWAALLATALLATNLVMLHFARDAFSELVSLIAIFGGLTVLIEARRTMSLRGAAAAGLILGLACMTRIDGLLLPGPIVAALVLDRLWPATADPDDNQASTPFVVLALAGVGLGAVIGYLDGRWFSPGYVGDLGYRVDSVLLAVGVIAVVAAVAAGLGAVFRSRVGALVGWVWSRRKIIAGGVIAALTAVFLYAWFIRPDRDIVRVEGPRPHIVNLQREEGLTIDQGRNYAEHAVVWMSWYLGPVLLATGFVGLLVACWRVIVGAWRALLPFIGTLLAMALLYFWRPSIQGLQIWAMRRYLPIVLPGLIFLAAFVIERLWHLDAGGRGRILLRGAAVVLALAGFGHAIATVAPVYDERTMVPMRHTLKQVCDHAGSDGAVLMPGPSLPSTVLPQSLQAFCDTPAAMVPRERGPDFLSRVAANVVAAGREPLVISDSREPYGSATQAVLEPVDSLIADVKRLEYRLTSRPDDFQVDHIEFHLWRVKT